MMESIKGYLRGHHGDFKASLAYVTRKTITFQTYGDYPTYATPDDEMIARMLNLPPNKNKHLLEISADRVKDHTAEYIIGNRMVYVTSVRIQICIHTSTNTSPQEMEEGYFYAIHSRWLGPNHVNSTASKAEMTLQMSTYDVEKRAWNCEKYVAHHVKYHIILGNLMEYGYQGLDPG